MEHKKVHKFYKTIKSRMLVAEVIERIKAGGKGRTADTASKFSAIAHGKLSNRWNGQNCCCSSCAPALDKSTSSCSQSLKILRLPFFVQFTFDFLMLLVLASMIAFMGLILNNTVVLVASMLVSPIMGPILAGIFGSVVGDEK